MRNGSVPAESPVFVDRSGVRRRWFVVLGVAGAGVLALSVLVLVAGFLGTGPGLPDLPVPAGPAARQAAANPAASAPQTAAVRASHPAASGATQPGAVPQPGLTPAVPTAPTASPTPTRHGNAPPHPSHRK
jgi:hypothetical protein